jgi:hypothetical protein
MSAMRIDVLLFLLLVGSVSASPTGVLIGSVRDAMTGEPLVGASVVINGTEYCNATDLKGHYAIVTLPEMAGRATAGYIGYDDTSASFVTTAACTTHLDFGLVSYLPALRNAAMKARARLPARSETRIYEHGGDETDEERMLEIRQVGDSVFFRTKAGPRWRDKPNWGGSGWKEGTVLINGFQMFWDSLNRLGFWHLKDHYSGQVSRKGEKSGYVSVSFEKGAQAKTSKTVGFYVPESCSLEFRLVYDMVWSMGWFAQPPKEEAVSLALRQISPSEMMSMLHAFPQWKNWSVSQKNDTEGLARFYLFSELTAAPLKRILPAARFYRGSDFSSKPPYPYLMAIAGDRRFLLPYDFNLLLLAHGLEVNDGNMIELAKAFVTAAIGGERRVMSEIRFLDATTVKQTANAMPYVGELTVKIGEQTEKWYFSSYVRKGQFNGVARRDASGSIKDYSVATFDPPGDHVPSLQIR